MASLLSKRPGVALGIAGALLAVAVVLVLVNLGRSSAPVPTAYYFDVADGKLFPAATHELPPVEAPSGAGNGVLAVVYSCGDCADTSSHRIARLEMFEQPINEQNPELSRRVALAPKAGEKVVWHPVMTPAGGQLMAQSMRQCNEAGENAMTWCAPGR